MFSFSISGQCRGLEGLASAIVKLWEKSEVAKIAMKRGVSRIVNDRMASELIVSYAPTPSIPVGQIWECSCRLIL